MTNNFVKIRVKEGEVANILNRLTKAQEEIYKCYSEEVMEKDEDFDFDFGILAHLHIDRMDKVSYQCDGACILHFEERIPSTR